MSNELMRKIDYLLGSPLCFILDTIGYIFKPIFFFKKNNVNKESKVNLKKILFIKLSEMGSIILAYPLIEQVKKELPKADMFFLTFNKNRSAVEVLNILPSGNILTIKDESPFLFIISTLKIILRLRRDKIDMIFDLELFSRFTAILTHLSHASK